MQPFLHAEIQAFSTKNKRGFAPLLASMQQYRHLSTQQNNHSSTQIKGAEPDCIRSKEGLKLGSDTNVNFYGSEAFH